jgi:transposase
MSKHSAPAGKVSGLLHRFVELRRKAAARTGWDFPTIVIQEAGLDGFWIHRVLQSEGIESHVVDAASILTSRRRRPAKTDRIDGETLVRTLMAYKRGEPRVCSMARAPAPQGEDRRRVCHERRTLVGERVRHVNRIKGLLFAQGVIGYEPLRNNRRERLEDLQTGDGRPLPPVRKAQIIRELDPLEVLLEQLKTVEAERDTLLKPAPDETASPVALLARLKGIGPETAAVLWYEGRFRQFDNRRQVAAFRRFDSFTTAGSELALADLEHVGVRSVLDVREFEGQRRWAWAFFFVPGPSGRCGPGQNQQNGSLPVVAGTKHQDRVLSVGD